MGGYFEICELLVKHNANVNEKAESGWSALLYATKKQHVKVVDLLLKHNANSNDFNKYWTALIFSSANGYFQICELLLKNGANPNEKKKNGVTSLLYASKK